jgi:hypothetical protein
MFVGIMVAYASQLDIDKFNRSNQKLWKLKMEDLLEEKYQWVVVTKQNKPDVISQDD